MTALDQAFIRAYLEESGGPGASQGEDRPAAEAVQIEPERQTPAPTSPALDSAGPSWMAPAVVCTATFSIEDEAPPAPCPIAPEPEAAVATGLSPDMEGAEDRCPSEPEILSDEVAPEEKAPTADSEAASFQPMLQVDGFAWSDRATSLRLAAGIQVDRLADGLAEGIAEGRKVIGIGGCRRRQGCTTLLLCAAKRLAARGLKVAMVDADFEQRALASRLGLLPEAGLEAVLSGRTPLEEVAIESMADQMAVVPLAAPCPTPPGTPQTDKVMTAALDTLRRCYDLVLVDLGQTGGGADDGPSVSCPHSWIDAIVLVQDVRTTPQADVIDVVRRAEAVGPVPLGVVENFV